VKSLSNVVSSKRLVEEERIAELEAKREIMKKRKNLELKMQEEELQLELDLAVSEAKTKVFDKYEQSDYSAFLRDTNVKRELSVHFESLPEPRYGLEREQSFHFDPLTQHRYERKREQYVHRDLSPQNRYRLDPNAETFRPKETQTTPISIDHNVNWHMETPMRSTPAQLIQPVMNNDSAIQAVVQNLRKPISEIKKFSGNPLRYRKFLRQFNAKVVMNCDNDEEKMNYLEQLTEGEALKVVTGYSHLSGARGYAAAMSQLEKRYGDTNVIATAFIKKALEWPVIRAGDTKSLDELALFLVGCQNGAESVHAGNVLEYSENIKRLMSKLSLYMHDR
jgi:hypothetical protein